LKRELAKIEIPDANGIKNWQYGDYTDFFSSYDEFNEFRNDFFSIPERHAKITSELENVQTLLKDMTDESKSVSESDYFTVCTKWEDLSSKTVSGWIDFYVTYSVSLLQELKSLCSNLANVVSKITVSDEARNETHRYAFYGCIACIAIQCFFAYLSHGFPWTGGWENWWGDPWWGWHFLLIGIFALIGGAVALISGKRGGIAYIVLALIMFFTGHQLTGVINMIAAGAAFLMAKERV
jgi:hypothetical protein